MAKWSCSGTTYLFDDGTAWCDRKIQVTVEGYIAPPAKQEKKKD